MSQLPRILVLDDVLGRSVAGGNYERIGFCKQFGLRDVTGDQEAITTYALPEMPFAEAVFFRCQTPSRAMPGDVVINDFDSVRDLIQSGWTQRTNIRQSPWALVLVDMCFYTGRVTAATHKEQAGMPHGTSHDREQFFGFELLRLLHEEFAKLPVIVMSSQPKAKELEKQYAGFNVRIFLDKNSTTNPKLIQDRLELYGLISDPDGMVIGQSVDLLVALQKARTIAKRDGPILLSGPSGTGKGLLARYIHRCRAKDRPFVEVNCSAIPVSLFENHLFGHVQGAFTGAVQKSSKNGYVQVAAKGILFLDEIGDLPLELQPKLLRLMREREFFRVGSEKVEKSTARLIFATDRDLKDAAEKGEFRRQLLNRITHEIKVPALAERRDDIPMLVEHFLRELEAEYNATKREVMPDAMDILIEQAWSGNVEELKTCLRTVVEGYLEQRYLRASQLGFPTASTSPTKLRHVIAADIQSVRTPINEDRLLESPATGNLSEMARKFPEELIHRYRSDLELLRDALMTSCHPLTKKPSPARALATLFEHEFSGADIKRLVDKLFIAPVFKPSKSLRDCLYQHGLNELQKWALSEPLLREYAEDTEDDGSNSSGSTSK